MRQPVAADFRGTAAAARHGRRGIDPISATERSHLARQNRGTVASTCSRLCQGTMLLRELTPRTRDAISSLGERLSVLLVAAALAERGVASAAIEATEL